jgi:hypothetical protein
MIGVLTHHWAKPDKIDEIYDRWRASPERAVAMKGADALWSKPPESERFEAV